VTAIELDPYVVDTLMPDLVGHDRQPSAFLVYLLLWRLTHGAGAAALQVPLRDLAAGTGLSKRAVQEALARLIRRRLVEAVREGATAVAVYTVLQPWRRK
jgi:DNA-binding GntR family transcriptional regulator